MAEFSYEDYFAQRAREAAIPLATDKYADVEKASNEKSAALEKLALIREQNKRSILGSIGLDVNSYTGAVVNTAVASVADAAGSVGINLEDQVATKEDTGFQHSSVQRRVGDVGVSALKSAVAVPELAVGLASMVSGGQAGKLLNEAGFRPDEAKAFLDTLYSHEQQAANENVQGAEGFWNTMAEMADNPSTVPHALLESLFPMLAGGVAARGIEALGLGVKAATALGEGTVMTGSAAEQIRGQTEDKRLTLKQALSAASTGIMGAAVARVGMKAGEKLGLGDIDEAVTRGAIGTSKNGALVNTLGAGTLEGVEEMGQSTGEQMISNFALDKDLTEGVGNAAAMGLVTGAAMGAPMGLADSGEAVSQKKRVAADKVTFDAAVAANDTTAFLDQEAPTYDPAKAVSVLLKHAKLSTASPETKAENLKQATAIVSDLDSRFESEQEAYLSNRENTPEDLAAFEAGLATKQAKLATLDPANPAHASVIEKTNQQITDIQAILTGSTPEALKIKKLDLDRMGRDLSEARKVRGVMQASPVDMAAADATVDATDATAVSASRAAVDNVINLSMQSPGSVSHEEASQLADNKSNTLTDDQRSYLRVFSEARIAENALKDMDKVTQEIYFGSDEKSPRKYVGIAQYQQKISEAITLGDKGAAIKQLAALTKFAENQQGKATAVNTAMSSGIKQIVYSESKGWEAPTQRLSDEKVTASGGNTLNSADLVAGILAGADALQKSTAAMKQAIDLKFNSKAAATTPAAQAQATPSPAAPVVSSAPSNSDTGQAVVATAKTAEAVEGKKESKVEERPLETKPVVVNETAVDATQTPDVESAPPTDAATPSPLIDRTDENSGSTLRPTETVGDTTQEATVASKDGVLTVFTKRLVRIAGESVNQLYAMSGFNQVAQFLKQDKTNEQDASTRPLVAVTDFISNWIAGNVNAEDYLDLGKEANKRELTEEEQSALKNLREFIAEWMPKLQKNFVLDTETQAAFRSDRMQDFYTVDENGVVNTDENVKTAIAYAIYSYILDKANAPALKTKEQVVEMHRAILDAHGIRDADPTILTEGMKFLQEADVFEETLVDDLGQRVIQALGLKALDKNTPSDLLPKLAVAFGTHAMIGLAQGKAAKENNPRIPGFIEIVEVPRNQIYEYFEIAGEEDSKVTLKYIKFNYAVEQREDGSTNQYGLTTKVRAINAAVTGSHGVVDKLFSVEHSPREALETPTKGNQKFAKGTKQEVSKLQAKAVDASQSTPHTVIPGMWHLKEYFGDDTLLIAAGWTEIGADNPNTHAINIAGVEAQNRNLEDQIDQANAMTGKNPFGKSWYIINSVWRNFRAGISTGSLNQQSSKIHRFLFSRPEWTVNIKFNDQELVNEFLISFAMAMGEKTDAQRNIVSLEKYFDNLEGTPTFKNEKAMRAIRAMQKSLNEGAKATAEDKLLVQEVSSGAEGMMSLQAMQVYAEFLTAMESGKDNFDVSMLVGADGKTNGPMLTLFALGATDYETLNRGGFYSTEENQPEHYSAYAESPGSRDLYQDVGSKLVEDMRTKVVKNSKDLPAALAVHRQAVKDKTANYLDVPFSLEQAAHLLHLTGNLYDRSKDKVESALRNLVKTPLTAFFFGSSLKNSARSMENAFIDSWYSTIEKIKQGKQKNGMTLASFIKATNGMIRTGDQGAPLLDENMDIDAAMQYLMYKNKKQEAAFRKGFQILMGNSVQSAFKPYFKTFIERRNQITQSVHAAHAVYLLAYEDAKQKMLADLMEKDEIRYRVISQGEHKGDIEYLQDLTVGQEAELQERIKALWPVAHNAMSKSEENLNAGSFMGKEIKDTSKAKLYKAVVMTRNGKRTNTSMVRKMVNNGVGSLSALIHSLDSANMHMAMNKIPGSMNVHDEIGNGVDKVGPAAMAINQTTSENLLNFSPAREAYNLLERSVVALVDGMKVGTYDAALVSKILASWVTTAMQKAEVPMNQVAAVFLTEAFDAANAADRDRLALLTKLASTDQYTWEGGQFKVDDAFRAKAQAMLDALPTDVSKDMRNAITFLGMDAQAQEFQAAIASAAKSKPDQELDATPVKAKAVETPFGKLGESRIPSDPKLVELFKNAPTMPVKDVLRALMKNMVASGASRDNSTSLLLAEQLYKNLAGSDLTVNYVTPEIQEADVLKLGAKGSMGWYVSTTEGKHAVYVLSPEFVDSGLTPELLLHELLHGVLARTITTEMNAKAPDSEAYRLIQDLETLRAKAIKYAGKDSKYAEALGNIHEFVSWGMTNQEFQREVLSNITMQSKTKQNSLVTGMKAFIKTITGLLFKNSPKSSQAITVNGMTVLISNVSGLLNQAAQNNAPQDTNLSQIAPVGYTTQSLFEALPSGNIDSIFGDHLQDLLGSIVEKLHGPFGSFKEQFMSTAAGTPVDIFAKAIQSGIAPFASRVPAMMKISSQEAFVLEQVEATVRAALSDDIASSKQAYRELSKLYREARERFTAADFASQEEYDFIFEMKATDDRTDHLSRFAALGLSHQKFNKLLQVPTKTKALGKSLTFSQWLQGIFDSILEMWNTRITATYAGQRMDIKLNALVAQLVDIEAKRRVAVEQHMSRRRNPGEYADDALSTGVSAVSEKLEAFGRSDWFRNRKSGVVQATGSVMSMILGGRQQLFMKQLSDLRDRNNAGRPGLMAGLLNDVKSPAVMFKGMLRAAKNRDKQAIHVTTQTAYFAMGGFINDGKDLTAEARDGISAVLLRTGAHILLDQFTTQEIEHMLNDKAALDKAINDEVAKLGAFPKAIHYFTAQAKYLAYALVTDQNKSEMKMKNAGNIASLYGTPYHGNLTEGQTMEAEATLDVLVSLYALSYSKDADLTAVRALMKKEHARTDGGNGIESVLRLHKELEQHARERMFAGSEALMAKGYLPEIYNPHIDVITANDAIEGADLLNQGYALGGQVTKDQADPDQTQKSLYVMRDAGKQPLLTGIMGYQDLSSKGSNAVGGKNNSAAVRAMTAAKQQAILQMFKPNPTLNPALVHGNKAAPILNAKGEIVNWHYLMNRDTKDAVLDRDNRFDKLLGQMAGSIYDKATVTENNTVAVQGAYEMYQAEFEDNTTAYIEVSGDSADPEMREIYRLLPAATKTAIKQIWGKESMMIRKDSLDILFGYHKLSLSSVFEKEKHSFMEAVFVFVVEALLEGSMHLQNAKRREKGLPLLERDKYMRRAAMVVRKNERIWQEIVKEMKDIIVVKTGTVMAANIVSNFLLLKMQGVPLADMVKNSLVAARGAREYQRDTNALFQLETQIESGFVTGNVKEVEREIVRLKDALSRNPVRGLIDAGLMPTIAEEIDATEDIYSNKSALVRKTDKYISKLNPTVVNAGKMVYMSRDGAAYKALSEITQLSDFVARYALYQHLTTRNKNQLTSEDAVQEAADSFVSYDIPMHRKMQYSDDMGFTMFSKYFIRVQHVIMKLAREHPGNMMIALILDNYLLGLPNIMESSPFARMFNNPFGTGALGYASVLDELATVNIALSPFTTGSVSEYY